MARGRRSDVRLPGTYPTVCEWSTTWPHNGERDGQPAPTAAFATNPVAPPTGEPITFTSTSTDPDGSIAKLEWDLDGDAATTWTLGQGKTATTSFPRPGIYPIRLRATDNNGAVHATTVQVTVGNRPPVAGFESPRTRPSQATP